MQQGPVSPVARGRVPSPRLVRIKMIKKRKIMALAVFGITAISIALICIVVGILENRVYSSLIMGVILLPLGIFSCLGCLKICCVDKGMKRIPLSSSPPESANDPPSNPLEQEQPSGTSFQTISLESSSSPPTAFHPATTHSRSSNEPPIGWSVPVPTSSLSEKPGAYSPQDSGTGNSYNPQTGASFNPHNPNIIVMANPYNPQIGGESSIYSPQTGESSPYNPNITGGSNPYTSQFGGAFNPHNPNIIITSNPHNAQMGETSSHHNSNITGASNSYNPIVRPVSSADSKEMEAAEAGPSSPQPRNKDDVSLPTYSDLFGK